MLGRLRFLRNRLDLCDASHQVDTLIWGWGWGGGCLTLIVIFIMHHLWYSASLKEFWSDCYLVLPRARDK